MIKYKLKDGVEASDIPGYSAIAKHVHSVLSNNSNVELDNIPKGLLEYVEEVKASAPKKEKEGGK